VTTIDQNGFYLSTYAQRLVAAQAAYQTIYGTSASVDTATPDGQLLALIAESQSNCDQVAQAVYNSFDPDGATGNPLTRIGAINFVKRKSGSYSYVSVTCYGTPGAQIVNPTIANSAKTQFSYTGTLTIGGGGSVSASFQSAQLGAFDVSAQTATRINPQFGWTSASITSGTQGAPFEQDPAFRIRRAQSVSKNAVALDDAMYAAVLAVPGISDAVIYDNRGQSIDTNGLPPHSIAVVTDGIETALTGGQVAGQIVAPIVWSKLAPGPTVFAVPSCNRPDGQASSVAYFVTDSRGTLRPIYLNQCNQNTPYLYLVCTSRAGYVATTSPAAIRSALAAWAAQSILIASPLDMDDVSAIAKGAVPGPVATLSGLVVSSASWGTSPMSAPGTLTPLTVDAFTRLRISGAHIALNVDGVNV
jgi:hypothetical protein